jgi:hypothetical protein
MPSSIAYLRKLEVARGSCSCKFEEGSDPVEADIAQM